MTLEQLRSVFPGLRQSQFELTSPPDNSYNCIAWSACDNSRWWWPAPGYFWPSSTPRAWTRDVFLRAYESMGFVTCRNPEWEKGVEKIALFVNDTGLPTHAARQLDNGRWTSKLGKADDIEHDLCALEGDEYGNVAVIMKRCVKSHQ